MARPLCPACGSRSIQKWGKTSSGAQRWRCGDCRGAFTLRIDTSAKTRWSARTLRRKCAKFCGVWPIPPLDVMVTDGSRFERARRETWQGARVQRCMLHAFNQVKRQTTTKPRLQAGIELYGLARSLLHSKGPFVGNHVASGARRLVRALEGAPREESSQRGDRQDGMDPREGGGARGPAASKGSVSCCTGPRARG